MEPWQHFFFVKEIQKSSVSPTRPSATPTSCTWIGHANADRARFFQVHALVEHISPRSTTYMSSQDRAWARERDLSSKPLSFSKERMRERERARERELQWRERVVAHASVGHTSSRSATCLHNLLVYRAGAKELKNAIYSPQLFLLQKKDWERASMTGESSWKNLNILQAEAEKLSGFTPRIQPSACGLGLYNARCKTR